jgi:hypothetical protein
MSANDKYLLLVTEEKLKPSIVEKLYDAGYIVVTVGNSATVRVLSPEQVGLPGDVMLCAALKAMVAQQSETYGKRASAEFVKFLADAAESTLADKYSARAMPITVEDTEKSA